MNRLLIAMGIMLTLYACSTDDPEYPEPPEYSDSTDNSDNTDSTDDTDNSYTPDDTYIPGSSGDTRDMTLRTHRLYVTTASGAAIQSKEVYVDCTVTMDSDNPDWCFENETAGIRGRGNSSWLWYDKKPYRIKFDSKREVLGLGKAKSWVLLANYRDPTDLMNTYVFELGQALGMPYTNHNRYVWLTLNGQQCGLYQLTEQVQQGKNRVEVSDDGGILLSLDTDDGPSESPDASDNFWSTVYSMPVCVKHPEDQTTAQLDAIKSEFATVETTIKSGTYEEAEALMDLTVLADFLLIQELVYNVELDSPRSMYMHRDSGGKWTMGPLWDFDGGYDFDWTNMYVGHHYFANFRELVMGTDPYTRQGASYNPPKFFTDLFRYEKFRELYKSEWTRLQSLADDVWELTTSYVLDEVWLAEQEMWPVGYDYARQIEIMQTWLHNRINYLNSFIPDL